MAIEIDHHGRPKFRGLLEDCLSPVDDVISEDFIPALFGTDAAFPNLRDDFSLNVRDGVLGITEIAKESKDSKKEKKEDA